MFRAYPSVCDRAQFPVINLRHLTWNTTEQNTKWWSIFVKSHIVPLFYLLFQSFIAFWFFSLSLSLHFCASLSDFRRLLRLLYEFPCKTKLNKCTFLLGNQKWKMTVTHRLEKKIVYTPSSIRELYVVNAMAKSVQAMRNWGWICIIYIYV